MGTAWNGACFCSSTPAMRHRGWPRGRSGTGPAGPWRSTTGGTMRFVRKFPNHIGFCTSMAAGKAAGRAFVALALLAAGTARAQLPLPASTQFDVTGYIEEATLDPACTADPHCGGAITVQGHVIVVPKEIVVMFPANALTWQELFAQAPLPYGLTAVGGPSSGLAAKDLPAALGNYEAHVI